MNREPISKDKGAVVPRMSKHRANQWVRWISPACFPGGRSVLFCLLVSTIHSQFCYGQGDSYSEPTPTTPQTLLAEELAVAKELTGAFPENADVLFLLGNVYDHHGKKQQAVATWRKGLSIDPNRAGVYVEIGRAFLRRGEYSRALGQWDRAGAVNPNQPELGSLRARALMGLGRHPEALAALQDELETHPQSANVQFLSGQIYLLLKQFDQARQCYENAIRITPSFTNAYYGLSKAYTNLKQPEKARDSLIQFRTLKSGDVADLKDQNEAYDDLENVKGHTIEVLLQAQKVYLNARDPDRALKLLNRAIQLDPQRLDTMVQLADFYQAVQQVEKAYQVLKNAQGLHGDQDSVWLRSGILAMQLNEVAAAETAFKKVVSLGSRSAEGYRIWATMNLQLNRNLPEALVHAEEAVALQPIAQNYFVLGWASARNGHPNRALEAMRQASRLDPSNPKYRSVIESIKQGNAGDKP